jgi:hypothetical protein
MKPKRNSELKNIITKVEISLDRQKKKNQLENTSIEMIKSKAQKG